MVPISAAYVSESRLYATNIDAALLSYGIF